MKRIVLAVEDDLKEQLLITRAVSEIEGVELVTVDTGGDAIDYINRRGPYLSRRPNENPSLVIVDHELPDMLAVILVRALREHPKLKNLPVFVYASDLNGDAKVYEEFAVDGPVMKPVADESFRAVVCDAVRRHLSV